VSENYERMARPPKDALREIKAGALKGKSDINPQWRYKIMDEVFGACGIGWKYEVVKLWDYPTQDGTVLAFAQINLYTKTGNEWSDPIPATGGNTLVDLVNEYDGSGSRTGVKYPKPNDEGYKMAITDALGTAMKMLGVAADIYAGRWDGSKYKDEPPPKPAPPKPVEPSPAETRCKELVKQLDLTDELKAKYWHDSGKNWANLEITLKAVKAKRDETLAKATENVQVTFGEPEQPEIF